VFRFISREIHNFKKDVHATYHIDKITNGSFKDKIDIFDAVWMLIISCMLYDIS
jgi:hypothetical protein